MSENGENTTTKERPEFDPAFVRAIEEGVTPHQIGFRGAVPYSPKPTKKTPPVQATSIAPSDVGGREDITR
jgi:hypothetical protein